MVTCAIVHVIALELKMWSIGKMESLFLVTTIMNWWRWRLTEDHQMWQLRCSCLETWGEGASCPCRRGGGWHDRSLGLGDIDQEKTSSVKWGERVGGDFLSMQERRGWITSTWKPWQLITPIVKPGRASKKPTEQLLLLWHRENIRQFFETHKYDVAELFSDFPHLLVGF